MVAVRGSRCGIRNMSSGVDRTAGASDTFQAHKYDSVFALLRWSGI